VSAARVRIVIALTALLLAAPAFAQQNSITVQPEDYFAKTCTGPAVGMAAGTGTTYVCQNGYWVHADLVPCNPDPPAGGCTGRPFCQSAINGEIYYCPSGQWITVAAQIRGCDNCTEGPASTAPNTVARFDGTTGKILKGSSAVLQDDGTLSLGTPLPVGSGGTGGSTSTTARAALGAAADNAVVHLSGDEVVLGTKTFSGTTYLGAMYSFRDAGIRRSDLFPDVATALLDLPAAGGVLQIGPEEDDPVSFVNINPATASSGRKSALALDFRKGGLRFLSSMPEYPSGPAGALEDRVPFVFQVRLDDATRTADDEFGAIGEWNCSNQPHLNTNCPYGNSTWGVQGGSKQYWYSGQCNALPSPQSEFGTVGTCSGPHIFEVRYPQTPGVADSKPVFAVGNGGAALYAPDNPSRWWRSYLTMFRGEDGGGDVLKANMPIFVFDKGGAFFDGGTYLGSTTGFPFYTQHTYPPFNLWVAHDVGLEAPGFVVEGTSDGTDLGEVSPLAWFLDRSGKGSFEHPGLARKAFAFDSHSRLYLGSYRDNVNAAERGQFIEWEGYTVDANTTKLRVAEPTQPNNIVLPDHSGTVLVAPHASNTGPTLWGTTGATGTDLCAGSNLVCAQTIAFESGGGTLTPRARNCTFVHTSLFIALCTNP